MAINSIAEWSFSQWKYHICINSFYILYNSSNEMNQLYLLSWHWLLVAVICKLWLIPNQSESWQSYYYGGAAASVLNIVWLSAAPVFIIIQTLGMQWAGASGVSISGPFSTQTDLELQQF